MSGSSVSEAREQPEQRSVETTVPLKSSATADVVRGAGGVRGGVRGGGCVMLRGGEALDAELAGHVIANVAAGASDSGVLLRGESSAACHSAERSERAPSSSDARRLRCVDSCRAPSNSCINS